MSTISSADTRQMKPDTRIAKLNAFFKAYNCPAPFLSEEYIAEADRNAIDYRILPAVSVRETTCGQHARLNNRWGWNSAKSGFISLAHGIRFIANQLASGKYYAGKSVEEKLKAYNPVPAYAGEVLRLMHEIDAD
jgi:hypothetical protein